MQYVIGAILVIIVLLIVGLILRKRIYVEVDQYENWKMEIMNRNIASELAKIKKLNLSGETQDKFNEWKNRWETIVTKDLSDVEEYLFDAEEAADRYRFPRANKILQKIKTTLQTIEDDLERMLEDLEFLLKSEESSREKIEKLKPKLDETRELLQTQRYRYGNASLYFQKEIRTLEEEIDTYYELVEEGNYSTAQEIATKVQQAFEEYHTMIDEFPEVYTHADENLPAQLDDLLAGINEMLQEGYHISSLAFDEEIRTYKLRLRDCLKSLEKGNLKEVKEELSDIEVRIQEIYDELEQEAIAKNYIDAHYTNFQRSLKQLNEAFIETKDEVDRLRQTYYLEDADMEKYLLLEKSVNQLNVTLEEMNKNISDPKVTHAHFRHQLEENFKQLESLQSQYETFKERIYNLRKDELESTNQLNHLRQQLMAIQRKLRQSNLPGIPEFIETSIERAEEKHERVKELLNQEPLDITQVKRTLKDAELATTQMEEEAEKVIEQAFLTEQVIQYANRYRSQQPILAAKLAESERLFRSYQYELALEQAVEAIEEVEPGALQKIEAHWKQTEVVH